MKKNNIILYIVIIFLQFYFVGCSKKEKEFTVQKIPTYYENGELASYDTIIKSNPYFESTDSNGIYYLYYSTGELKEKAEFFNGRLINENIIYGKSGEEISYRFYNPDGELLFIREFSAINLIAERRNPFMYFIYSNQAKINDTIPITVFISTPSGFAHDLYGLLDDGTPYILNASRLTPFSYQFNYIPKKQGKVILRLKLIYTEYNNTEFDYYKNLDFYITKK